MRETEQSTTKEMGITLDKQIETTQVGGVVYDIEKLRSHADSLPEILVDISELKEAVGEGHYYWIDIKGEKLGPHQILQDWKAAQHNPAWVDHVATIKRADLSKPIWRSVDGTIFDGMHGLTAAILNEEKEIKLKQFDELPLSAAIKEG
jgi:hypothetical protein